jgi:hypothetical protein
LRRRVGGRSQVYSTGNTLENGGGSHPQSSILEESGAQPAFIGRKRKSKAGSCVLSWVFITQGVFLLFLPQIIRTLQRILASWVWLLGLDIVFSAI